jgi:hypothetical protein
MSAAATSQLIRGLMASATRRVSDDAAHVAEMEAMIAQMQINLQAAKARLQKAEASVSELQKMWVAIDA